VRILVLNNPADTRQELCRVGVDPAVYGRFQAKQATLAVKLDDLPASAAGILKQTALALGADVAVHRDVIRGRKRRSDAILFANRRQLARILERLGEQPPATQAAGQGIAALLAAHDCSDRRLRFGSGGTRVKAYDLGRRTYIMGILNVTPDSFSDGGKYLCPNDAIDQGLALAEAGADFLDLGAESTRPGALPVGPVEEITRLRPVLKGLRRQVKIPISIDTCRAVTARNCLDLGADMVNDVTALQADPGLAGVVSRARVPCVLMHVKGTPRTMQRNPRYRDLMAEIHAWLEQRVAFAVEHGIGRERLVIDPGIGFGKSVADNFAILRRLAELKSLGRPILVGPSRKSFIGRTLDLPVEERLEGTLAACVLAARNGANVLRVHDVRAARRALAIADRVLRDEDGGR
jgi:dihydropteroate synthase